MWSIMAYIVLGMLAGWVASLLVRHDKHPSDWGMLFLIGVAGSLVGGIVVNLLLGEGFKLSPGGLISSILFASLILWIVTATKNRGQGKPRRAADGTHREPKGGSRHHKR